MHVHIVDDEPELVASMKIMLTREGHEVRSFCNANAFLAVAADIPPGCVLLDLRLPDLNGLEVQARLKEVASEHVVVLLTGYGEVPDAVTAIREGALDFLGKPFRQADLKAALARAQDALEVRALERQRTERFAGLTPLSSREGQVLRALASGKPSKVVAFDLALSVRTIETHRANILKKLGVPNIGAALVLAMNAGLID